MLQRFHSKYFLWHSKTKKLILFTGILYVKSISSNTLFCKPLMTVPFSKMSQMKKKKGRKLGPMLNLSMMLV